MDSERKPPLPFPRKILIAIDEKNLPPPAPVLFRTLAFVADGLLVSLATMLALKFLLPVFSPDGFGAFADYFTQLRAAYENALAAAASGRLVPADAVGAIVERASNDATLLSFFETAYAISFAVAALYFLLTEQFLRGQTLGKKIFGLRTVVFGSARPPFFLQTLSRAFWKAATLVPAGLILTILVIVNAHVVVFARRHRGWHDRLTRTEVIDARTGTEPRGDDGGDA